MSLTSAELEQRQNAAVKHRVTSRRKSRSERPQSATVSQPKRSPRRRPGPHREGAARRLGAGSGEVRTTRPLLLRARPAQRQRELRPAAAIYSTRSTPRSCSPGPGGFRQKAIGPMRSSGTASARSSRQKDRCALLDAALSLDGPRVRMRWTAGSERGAMRRRPSRRAPA
jgi:hypothetical protein